MTAARLCFVALICSCLFVSEAGSVELSRGVNAATWFTWPRYVGFNKPGIREPIFPPDRAMPSEQDFRQLAGLGFRTLRLAVDPALFEVLRGKRGQSFGVQFDAALRQAIANGLTVIVDLHPNSKHTVYGQHALRPGGSSLASKAYLKIVGEVAARLDRFEKGKVVLELMNEPRGKCSGVQQEQWEAMVDGMVAAASNAAPQLPLIISGACTSSIEGLLALNATRWRRDDIYYTFHFYEPFAFTHQGASFIAWPERYLSSVPWPTGPGMDVPKLLTAANDRTKSLAVEERQKLRLGTERVLKELAAKPVTVQTIKRRFELVAQWADTHKIPRQNIFLGEFGVYASIGGKPGAACTDQARWITAVREITEQEGFSWAFFHRDGAFGLLDDKSLEPNAALLKALGLRADGKCPATR